jgi:hypothetical protein
MIMPNFSFDKQKLSFNIKLQEIMTRTHWILG